MEYIALWDYRRPKIARSNESGKAGTSSYFRSDAEVAQFEYAIVGLQTLHHNCNDKLSRSM
jgi:hypothetical protein